MLPARKILLAAACAAACACLSACGGGGEIAPDGNTPPNNNNNGNNGNTVVPKSFVTIGGAVDSAFTGKLVLQDQYAVNGATRTDQVTLSTSGAFQVSSQVPQGDSYQVSVATQPPDQYCTVAQGSGTAQAAVSNVAVTCAAGTESLLAALATGDGINPTTPPLQASNGDFYLGGDGGSHNQGAVLQITPAGKISVLYSFAGGAGDGAAPNQTLVQGPNGDLYGVTASGGSGAGTIFELTLGGAETVLHFFSGGTTDGATPSSPLLLASDGNFYGVTSGGGANSEGTLYRISPTGSYTLLHSFAVASNGGPLTVPEGALIQASNGELVGTCYDGGAGDNGGVFTFDPKTDTKTDLAQGNGATFAGPQFGVIQGSDGNYYGLTDYGGNVLFKVTPSGTASVVYNFNSGASGALASAVGQLVQASDGELYGIASQGGVGNDGGVFRVDPATGAETSVHLFQWTASNPVATPILGLMLGSNGWLYGAFSNSSGGGTPGGVFGID